MTPCSSTVCSITTRTPAATAVPSGCWPSWPVPSSSSSTPISPRSAMPLTASTWSSATCSSQLSGPSCGSSVSASLPTSGRSPSRKMCGWEPTQPAQPSPSASSPSSPGVCWPRWPTSATRLGWTTSSRTMWTPHRTPAQPIPPTRARLWTATSSRLLPRTLRPRKATSHPPLCTELQLGMVRGAGRVLPRHPSVLDSFREACLLGPLVPHGTCRILNTAWRDPASRAQQLLPLLLQGMF